MDETEDLDDLVAYLDDEADAPTQQRIEARMAREPALRAEADALKRAWDLLDYLPRPEPAADFTQRTISKLTFAPLPASASAMVATPPVQRWQVPWWGIVATLAATLAGFAVADGVLRTRPVAVVLPLDRDPLFASDAALIDQLALYDPVETVEFLRALETLEPFGGEAGQ